MKKRAWSRLGIGFGMAALALGLGATPAHAISEKGYATAYLNTVVPWVRTNAETYTFKTRDGTSLSGVRIVHPNAKGTILILTGRTEPWLKYGEVFYDLYQQGYTLYSYDHRGQGRSPHLVASNREIGHIEKFNDYVGDLEDFIAKILLPAGEKNLYLLAHSMGGGIAAQYLTRGKTPFKAAVLNAPMLSVNTAPYAVPIAMGICLAQMGIGDGEGYAHGKTDYDPNAPFEGNGVTGSPERWWMTNAVFRSNPETILGGPSAAWVYRTLVATPKIVRKMKGVTTPVLMFQAGDDSIVTPKGENVGCAATKACRLMKFPGAQHEILMEKDSIRDRAFAEILKFFQ
jgi:lysophospholipase